MPSLRDSQWRRDLVHIVQQSRWLMRALHAVRALEIESWCIGAGAMRNVVWDYLHGYREPSALADVDVAYFDLTVDPGDDQRIQKLLQAREPSVPWEITNQAFVHTWFEAYFGHPVEPLRSLEEAVASWPEFATSVGVSLTDEGRIEITAPHGLDDLFEMRVQRNPTRVSVETYRSRVLEKQYLQRWPRVAIIPS